METPVAFQAFVIYRDMGPERSLRAVARQLSKSIPLIKRWSRAHGWIGRARQHDKAMDKTKQDARFAAVSKAERQRWQIKVLRDEWELSQQLFRASRAALQKLAKKPGFGEIARALDVASKLGRLSAGMSTEAAQLTVGPSQEWSDQVNAAIARVLARRQAEAQKVIDLPPGKPTDSA